MKMVPALFVAVILFAGLLGELVARGYSEPMNRWLRNRWGDGAKRMGAAVEFNRKAPSEERGVEV